MSPSQRQNNRRFHSRKYCLHISKGLYVYGPDNSISASLYSEWGIVEIPIRENELQKPKGEKRMIYLAWPETFSVFFKVGIYINR